MAIEFSVSFHREKKKHKCNTILCSIGIGVRAPHMVLTCAEERVYRRC